MIGAIGKSGLIEMGFKKLGVRNGKTVYKRIVPKFDLSDCMTHSHNGTRARQVTEFAYLDEATDKVVQTATRRVGEYGASAKAVDRRTNTEFTREILDGGKAHREYAHYTETIPVRNCVIEGKLPGLVHVSEHYYPKAGTTVGRNTDFVTFNTNGEILSRGRVRVPQLAEDSADGVQKVWLYNRGVGHKANHIQSSYVSHQVAPNGGYRKSIEGSGTIYTPEAQVGIPKYTSLTDLKTNNEFFTKEFNA